MPNFTPNYNIKKPLQTENYNVDDFNGNMDIIDTELKEVYSVIAELPKKPSSAVSGNVAKFNENKEVVDSGFTIEKSVPSDAKFTDTIYTHPNDANTRHVTDVEKANWNLKLSIIEGTYVGNATSNRLILLGIKPKVLLLNTTKNANYNQIEIIFGDETSPSLGDLLTSNDAFVTIDTYNSKRSVIVENGFYVRYVNEAYGSGMNINGVTYQYKAIY